MKQVLDAAGIRTPRHASTTTVAGVWEAVERIGYPIIVKPIAGAGSADTYRVDSSAELSDVLPLLRHVPEVSVEEFVDGRGAHVRHGLRGRGDPVRERDVVPPAAAADAAARVGQPGVHRAARPVRAGARGRPRDGPRRCWPRWASAPGSRTWSGTARPTGEAVFGEIAARPPGRAGGRPDELRLRRRPLRRLGRGGAARAAAHADRRSSYNVRQRLQARARPGPDHRHRGPGRAARGVRRARRHVDLLPIGAPRRDWRTTTVGDGGVVVRHRELQKVIEMTDAFARDLQLYAG